MQELIRKLLADLGEDPAREGLRDTPKRVEKAYKFLTSGYDANIDQVLNNALFTVDYSEMVIVKDIDFYSLCEHHLLPFFGKCHVAYIPSNKVIGLSKVPRLVDVFARRLQVQERLTSQIADTIREKITPLLHLQATREDVDQPRHLAQADHFVAGNVGDVALAEERQHVMLAQAVEVDVPDDHHLVILDAEQRPVQHRVDISLVPARQELQRGFHPLRRPDQALT